MGEVVNISEGWLKRHRLQSEVAFCTSCEHVWEVTCSIDEKNPTFSCARCKQPTGIFYKEHKKMQEIRQIVIDNAKKIDW